MAFGGFQERGLRHQKHRVTQRHVRSIGPVDGGSSDLRPRVVPPTVHQHFLHHDHIKREAFRKNRRAGIGDALCQNDFALTARSTGQPLHKESLMSSDLIKHISDASFDGDVTRSSTPVLVDYWAEWCGPCKAIAPILDEVSKTYDGRLQVAKMNVDENTEVPAKFNIRGIPTLMIFKDGQMAATKVGAMTKAQLIAFIDSNL
jgi:thioredoxin 1